MCITNFPFFTKWQIVSFLAAKGNFRLRKISEHFPLPKISIVKIGNLAVKGVNIIGVELGRGQSRTSLNWWRATHSAYAGNIDVEVILPVRACITNLKRRSPRRIPWILIGTDLHPIDMFITWKSRLNIEGNPATGFM